MPEAEPGAGEIGGGDAETGAQRKAPARSPAPWRDFHSTPDWLHAKGAKPATSQVPEQRDQPGLDHRGGGGDAIVEIDRGHRISHHQAVAGEAGQLQKVNVPAFDEAVK